jgi:serine/threonine protein kinase
MFEVRGTVGNYELVTMLGRRRGMAGMVYLAVDGTTRQRVALKVFQPQAGEDLTVDIAAEREGAKLQEQLAQHTKLVPAVYACGEDRGVFFVAMEYIEGDDLDKRIGNGRTLAPEEAARVVRDICACLTVAHAPEHQIDGKDRSIIHGDIKPGNIRLTESGDVRLLDFGIAKPVTLTRSFTHNTHLTVEYASPERLSSNNVDAHADLWAAGVVLYEAIAGRRPWDSEGQDRGAVERAITSGVRPSELPGSCPSALAHITFKALAPRLLDRYQTAEAMRTDLDAFLAGTAIVAVQEASTSGQLTVRTPSRAPETARSEHSAPPAPVPPTLSPPTLLPPTPGRAVQKTPSTSERAAPARRGARSVLLLRAGAAAMVGFLVVHEAGIWWRANRLASRLAVHESTLNEAWSEYESLSDASLLLGAGTTPVRRTLREALLGDAQPVLADFRGPIPSVHEAQWERASQSLSRALAMDSRDQSTRALLRYCEGQIARINGEARLERKQMGEARGFLNAAVAAFQDAARLKSDWPDPYLGLARTYIYGFDDIDQAAAAFTRAESLGYKSGSRERAQIADGYARRADKVRRDPALRGIPQERAQLQAAAADYRTALDMYGQLRGFADANRRLRLTQAALQAVEKRLADIDAAAVR